jgi:hypothetical protein
MIRKWVAALIRWALSGSNATYDAAAVDEVIRQHKGG